MPLITAITVPRHGSKSRLIELDGEPWRGTSAIVVTRLGIAPGDEADAADLGERLDEVEPACARDRAYALLSYRDRTESLLVERLMADGFPEGVARFTVAHVVSLGFVDDTRYAHARAHALTEVRKLGRGRAQRELVRDGVSPEIAADALDCAFDPEREYSSALSTAVAASRRTGASRDKVIARLLRRGFSPSVAIRAAREALPDAPFGDTMPDERVDV